MREGITLVHIPCWWTGDSYRLLFFKIIFFQHLIIFIILYNKIILFSLAAAIHFHRPDLHAPFPSLSPSIPLNPNPGYFSGILLKNNIGLNYKIYFNFQRRRSS